MLVPLPVPSCLVATWEALMPGGLVLRRALLQNCFSCASAVASPDTLQGNLVCILRSLAGLSMGVQAKPHTAGENWHLGPVALCP